MQAKYDVAKAEGGLKAWRRDTTLREHVKANVNIKRLCKI